MGDFIGACATLSTPTMDFCQPITISRLALNYSLEMCGFSPLTPTRLDREEGPRPSVQDMESHFQMVYQRLCVRLVSINDATMREGIV